jgi:hypothetical protein
MHVMVVIKIMKIIIGHHVHVPRDAPLSVAAFSNL